MPRADIRFFGAVIFFTLSCAVRPRTGDIRADCRVFADEEFSILGEAHWEGHLTTGYYSYALKSSAEKTDFLFTGPMGSSVKDEDAGKIAAAAVDALKGKSDFIKSVKYRGNEIRFRFSRNPSGIKSMTAFMENGLLKRIKLYFRKGFADIEISDIIYAENQN
ncbi:hypothetical protein KJ633_00880 [bacterium]|nr:hypothetical protein [bacterium]MBU3954994.1 hypothetical protein [bacterium]